MRAVGPLTQQAIDAQVFEPGLRVVVFDEFGAEFTLPFDAIIGWPRAEFDLDRMTWRYTLRVRRDESTDGLIYQGREIKAWRSFAPGEELEEFSGYIADLQEKVDYSSGHAVKAWDLECLGLSAKRLDAHLTRFDWRPTVINPGIGEANNRARITGIVKRYKVTISYSHSSVSTTLSAPPTVDTLYVASTSGFSVGDVIWIVEPGSFGATQAHKITSIPNSTTLKVDGGVRTGFWPMGTMVRKSLGVIPMTGPFFFPDTNYSSHVTVYDSSGTQRNPSWGWSLRVDLDSMALGVLFTSDPGATFTVDIFVMDRWVILDRRRYNGSLEVPYFYVLSGIQGQSEAERLNDRALTIVKTTGTASEIVVDDPSGIFASDSYSDRWVSVWAPDGTEYRGKVGSVDKTKSSSDYGKITMASGYPLRSATGSLPSSVGGGWKAGNTSSTHFEILDTSARFVIYDAQGNYGSQYLQADPNGGWMFLGFKDKVVTYFVPGRYPDLSADANSAGLPMFHAVDRPFAVPLAAGNYDQSMNAPENDVAEFFRQLFEEVGYDRASLDLEDTGYTLAPLTRANVKALDLLDEVRKAVIPPNYRIWEDEGGIIRGRYVAQKSSPDLQLVNIQAISPKEIPQPLTRVIVKGRQLEINRAGQMFYASDGIGRIERLFDGFQDQYANAAPMTKIVDPGQDIYAARAAFRIPACEPGRYPNVAKVVVATGEAHVTIGGGPTPEATTSTRYLPTGIKPYDATEVFNRLEYSNLTEIAKGSGVPGDPWYLLVMAEAAGGGCIDEIEIYLREGAYWEAALTDRLAVLPAQDLSNAVLSAPGTEKTKIAGDMTLEFTMYLDSQPASTRRPIVTMVGPGSTEGSNMLFGAYLSTGSSIFGAIPASLRFVWQYGPSKLESDVGVSLGFVALLRKATTIAIERDTAAKKVRFYVDGVFRSESNYTNDPTGGDLADLFIGNENGGTFFDGKIAEVRLWDHLRGAENIRRYSDVRLTGRESGLVAYYRMDEAEGPTYQDSSSNANHLTLSSGTAMPTVLSMPSGAIPDRGEDDFGTTWRVPNQQLAVSERYVPGRWLRRTMANYHKGLDRVLIVEADGITVAQAREVAEAYLDQALRGTELYDISVPFDPRLQPTDTVEALVLVYEDDGNGGRRKVCRSRLFTVLGIVKDRTTMRLKAGDYSR